MIQFKVTHEQTPRASFPTALATTISQVPATTMKPSVSRIMASPKKVEGSSHTMKTFTNAITPKLNAKVIPAVWIQPLLVWASNFNVKIALMSPHIIRRAQQKHNTPGKKS